jgi:hypothetical protein
MVDSEQKPTEYLKELEREREERQKILSGTISRFLVLLQSCRKLRVWKKLKEWNTGRKANFDLLHGLFHDIFMEFIHPSVDFVEIEST